MLRVRSAVLLLSLAALACGVHAAQTDKFANLFKWIEAAGGDVSAVEAKVNADGVRGLFLTRDVKAREIFLKVPASCILNLGGPEDNFATSTMTLLREVHGTPVSRFRPYLDIMPRPDEVLNACNMEPVYGDMMESEYWQQYIDDYQQWVRGIHSGAFNRHLDYTLAEVAGNAPVTLEDVAYQCAISTSRQTSVSSDRNRTNMIPVYDMANHVDDCDTYFEYDDRWFTMTVPRDMRAGQELCVSYSMSDMRPDYAVVIYGYLPKQANPPVLAYVDHPQFVADKDNAYIDVSDAPVRGRPDSLLREANRLEEILLGLGQLPQPGTPHGGPAPGKEDPQRRWVGDMMREFQKRRRLALRFWIEFYRAEAAALANAVRGDAADDALRTALRKAAEATGLPPLTQLPVKRLPQAPPAAEAAEA